jgi:FAD/FMN-containing dehydrogenase
MDNLVSVQLVMADGSVVTASDQENPDLFWAVRGAGANFGIATSLEYRLHQIGPTVTGGLVAHLVEGAREMFQFCRELMASAPDELCVAPGLLYAPDGSGPPLAGMVVSHSGTLEAAKEAVKPIQEFGSPVMDTIGPLSYYQLNTMLDAYYPKGISYYWKARFLTEMSDEAIDTMIDCFSRCPNTTSQIILEPYHGVASRVAVDAMAYPIRVNGFNLLVLSQWTDSSQTEQCIEWTRETYDAMEPFMTEARYSNYLAHDEAKGSVAAAYGPNYQRLCELKQKYDPNNFFHVNANLPPLS